MTEKLSECCKNCNGEGRIELNSSSMMAYWATCSVCNGSGKIKIKPCTIASKPHRHTFTKGSDKCQTCGLLPQVVGHGGEGMESKPEDDPSRLPEASPGAIERIITQGMPKSLKIKPMPEGEIKNYLYKISTDPVGYEFTPRDGTLTRNYCFARVNALVRAAQADALRQVIEEMKNKKWACIDIGTLQSALEEMEKEIK